MNDPFGNIQNFIGQFRQFMSNPAQMMMQNKLNIPQEYMKNPNDAIQYLMDTGKLTQDQYNQASRTANMIKPFFKQSM